MKILSKKNSTYILLISLVTYLIAYYVSILAHEWGHGTAAWLLGQKTSPFDVYYGGWALLHVDENVNYNWLLATHQGSAAAIIGISGISVSIILLLLSFILLNCSKIQNNPIIFILFYWFVAINIVPALQYFTFTTFSSEGDVGRFTHGLHISPWWIFIPGTILVIIALWRIFKIEAPRAYAVIPIKSLWGQRLFLLATLSIIFLFIYTHGYNPITDKGTNLPSKVLAIVSIFLVLLLFFVCNPSRDWVKIKIENYRKFLLQQHK